MTMVSLPNILFKIEGASKRLSDIEFLSIKEFEGKRVDDVNNGLDLVETATETDLVTQTATALHEMYLASATFIVSVTAASSPFDVTVRLYANNIVIETFVQTSIGLGQEFTYRFRSRGNKVEADDIIKITVQNSVGAVNRATTSYGKIELWQEETGISPQV